MAALILFAPRSAIIGHWRAAALRRALLMRVLPAGTGHRKWASKSPSRRRLTASSAGWPTSGRPAGPCPHGPACLLRGFPPLEPFAGQVGRVVNSTQLLFRNSCSFVGMSVPHRNYPSPAMTWRPYQHHEPPAQPATGDEPLFTIIPPLVRKGRGPAGEHLAGIGEIRPAFCESAWPPASFHPRSVAYYRIHNDYRLARSESGNARPSAGPSFLPFMALLMRLAARSATALTGSSAR